MLLYVLSKYMVIGQSEGFLYLFSDGELILFSILRVYFKMSLPLHFLLNYDDHIFDTRAYFDVASKENVTHG